MQEEGLLQTKLSQFTWSSEASTIASIFVFTVISTVFSEVAPLWALQVVGTLDDSAKYQTVIGLARTFLNCVVLLPGIGLVIPLFSLIPQALGANKFELLDVHFRRTCFLIFTIGSLLMALLLLESRLYTAIGYSKDITNKLWNYSLLQMPLLIEWLFFVMGNAYCVALLYQKFFSFWNLYGTGMMIGGFYFFIKRYGYLGAIYAQIIGYAISGTVPLLTCMLAPSSPWRAELNTAEWADVMRWNPMKLHLKLSAGWILSKLSSWLSWELIIIFVGIITKDKATLAASAVFIEVGSFMIMITMCIGTITCARVGYYLGKSAPHDAKKVLFICIPISCAWSLIVAFVSWYFADDIVKILSNDHDVRNKLAKMIPIMSITLILNVIRKNLEGVVMAFNKTYILSIVNFLGYYIFALGPACVVVFMEITNFTDFQKVMILLWTRVMGALSGSIMLLVYVLCIDWEKMAFEINSSLQEDKGEEPNLVILVSEDD